MKNCQRLMKFYEKKYPATGDKIIITTEKQRDDTEIKVALWDDGKRSLSSASVLTSNKSSHKLEKKPPMHISIDKLLAPQKIPVIVTRIQIMESFL